MPRREIASTPDATHGGPRGSVDESDPVRLDFSVSLNAWGPAVEVATAARAAPLDRYPDPESLGVRRAASARWGRPVEEIAFGAGAAELIHAVCFAFVRPGDRVVVAEPTFGEYARASGLCGARVVAVPPRGLGIAHGELAGAVGRTGARLAFLCSPNNPTGEPAPLAAIEAVAEACRKAGALLVLDQSYDAFLDEPLGTPALPGHPAVLAVRSITKDHALAGIRAAFAVGPAAVIAAIERVRVPWAASTAAQDAAVAALSDPAEAHVQRTTRMLRAERLRLEDGVARLGIPTAPTATHFLLAEVGDAAVFSARLRREAGIAVRDCTSFGLPAHVRFAARLPEENDKLLRALEASCSG